MVNRFLMSGGETTEKKDNKNTAYAPFRVFRVFRECLYGVDDILEGRKGDRGGGPKKGQNSIWGKTGHLLKLPNIAADMDKDDTSTSK